MRKLVSTITLCLISAAAGTALAQGVPTTQPKFLHIFREQVKAGRAAEHSKYEAAWPAAFERAKNPYNYIALQSVTGAQEVWYVTTLANQAAYGEMIAAETATAGLSVELDRLQHGDGDFLSSQDAIQAVAMPELSHGGFPDIARMRFWEITTFRMKPGHREDFVAAAKAYVAATARLAPGVSFRTYEVVAGAADGTYLIFSSVASFADFDKDRADSEAIWKGLTSEERTTLQKAMTEGVMNTVTNRYRLDPRQSYVTREIREKDPAFWMPKTTVARGAAVGAAAKPAVTSSTTGKAATEKPMPVSAKPKTPGQP